MLWFVVLPPHVISPPPPPKVLYAIKEYACTAIDVIARRTRLGFLNVQAADEALPRIVQIMGKELGWSEEQKTVRRHADTPKCPFSIGTQ